MDLVKRKLVTIITEANLQNILIGDFKKMDFAGYTISEATGEGDRGVRQGDWEQNRNIRVEIVCEEGKAHTLLEHLTETYFQDYAMITFISEVEVVRPDKF
jgi:nitrogen regulatory protein PII